MKLHTGDTVVVITGKDKGKTGTVMRVIAAKQHVVVSGVNMRTRHIRKTYQQAGRILKYEASMPACKVMLLDPKTKKPTRIGFQTKDGKKVRIAKLSGEVVRKVAPPKNAPVAKKETDAAKKPEATPTKQPFWNKMKFGSNVADGAPDEARSKQDHTIPSQTIPPKTSGRGS